MSESNRTNESVQQQFLLLQSTFMALNNQMISMGETVMAIAASMNGIAMSLGYLNQSPSTLSNTKESTLESPRGRHSLTNPADSGNTFTTSTSLSSGHGHPAALPSKSLSLSNIDELHAQHTHHSLTSSVVTAPTSITFEDDFTSEADRTLPLSSPRRASELREMVAEEIRMNGLPTLMSAANQPNQSQNLSANSRTLFSTTVPLSTTEKSSDPSRATRSVSDQPPAMNRPRSMDVSNVTKVIDASSPSRNVKEVVGLDDPNEDPPAGASSQRRGSCPNPSIYLHNDYRVKLNVGGVLFISTMSTLMRDAEQGSMLSAMLNGKWPVEKDEAGAFFLDRDPNVFRHILNYLRDGSLLCSSMNTALKQAILREARFYQLRGLINILTTDLRKSKQELRHEPSGEKEYKLLMNVLEKDLQQVFTRVTLTDGYDFEDWIGASPPNPTLIATTAPKCMHLLFSKQLSRGEVMLLDRLQ